jgi:Holliday junction resolvase RusA-like endonuclease
MILKRMQVRFDITRNQNPNRKSKNIFLQSKNNKQVKKEAALIIDCARRDHEYTKTYFGAIINRYWFFTNNRKRDLDNFCAGTKYINDAFQSAGMIKNDANIFFDSSIIFYGQEEEGLLYDVYLIETELDFICIRQKFYADAKNGLKWYQQLVKE